MILAYDLLLCLRWYGSASGDGFGGQRTRARGRAVGELHSPSLHRGTADRPASQGADQVQREAEGAGT